MNSLNREDAEPVSKLIRALAWFIVLVGFVALGPVHICTILDFQLNHGSWKNGTAYSPI